MKLSTTIAFNGDPKKLVSQVRDLGAAGIDRIWGGEIYGYDLVSTLAYLAGQTERVELMTGILPVYSRRERARVRAEKGRRWGRPAKQAA